MEQQWKMIYLAKRNPKLAASEFSKAWKEHSALGSQCHNVRDKVTSVTQCSRVLEDIESLHGISTEYDGVNLLLMTNLAATREIWTDEETLRIMRPDELRVFSTYVRNCTIICTEHVLKDFQSSDYCIQLFIKPSPHIQAEQLENLFPLLSEILLDQDSYLFSRTTKTVVNLAHGESPAGFQYAAVVECWYDSLSLIKRAFRKGSVWSYLPQYLTELLEIEQSICLLTQVNHRRP